MMIRRTPLRTLTPIRKKRSKPRRGQPTREEKTALRKAVYERAGGKCELHILNDCIPGVLPWDGGVFERGHLAHIHSRGAGGKWNETNCKWSCWRCHLIGMHSKGLIPNATIS